MRRKPWDVLIKGGSVVLADRVERVDIGIKDGVITKIAPMLSGEDADRILIAEGRHVFAGVVDAHVHLNEPGLGEWEGFVTGTAALAAGGCTSFIDMPLNGIPPTINTAALERKLEAARNSGVRVDYAIWGGLVPGNSGDLAALSEAGVVGYKAFMSFPGDTGDGCFENVDEETLLEGMKIIASLGHILALHAENEPIVAALAAEKRAAGRVAMRDYLDSRPPHAELEAVRLAIDMASVTGCKLHFVHISTPEAIELIDAAKRDGLNVTAETCPHYLVFTDEDVIRIGAEAKCSPPIRTGEEREALWRQLAEGKIDIVASDHSPCPPAMKNVKDDDYFTVWGGILGGQSTLEAVVSEGWLKRGIPLPVLSRTMSAAPAARFGLERKGSIAIGLDADIAIVDLDAPYVLTADQLKYRHAHSAYEGIRLGCRVETTLLRGRIVYDRTAGKGGLDTEAPSSGRLLLPRAAAARTE
ncbi:allantoinase AllB [Paenibacillus sacheonensis]|uniref:Allantoinase n=1 Tax=Paenibacillus sacheonensis TaxID=742054 RepID=A0A7X4YL36_9BACL|nr:allantoinase AllB [Paenibacillus sacheonensis]MBM7563146.1 allantoinase [Paenibacillus sacheonensis]NBC68290.1 allantoinase AllB [Paenibacillus sacheonensis]